MFAKFALFSARVRESAREKRDRAPGPKVTKVAPLRTRATCARARGRAGARDSGCREEAGAITGDRAANGVLQVKRDAERSLCAANASSAKSRIARPTGRQSRARRHEASVSRAPAWRERA